MAADTNARHAERIRDDAAGGIDPTIRVARKQAHRSDGGDAFLPDPYGGAEEMIPANDAESFAEEFIAAATTGEDVFADAQDEVAEDEDGGPFLELDAEGDEITDADSEPVSVSQITGGSPSIER